MPSTVELLGTHLRRSPTCHPQLRHEVLRQKVAGSLPSRSSMPLICHLQGVKFSFTFELRRYWHERQPASSTHPLCKRSTLLGAESFTGPEFWEAITFEHALRQLTLEGPLARTGAPPSVMWYSYALLISFHPPLSVIVGRILLVDSCELPSMRPEIGRHALFLFAGVLLSLLVASYSLKVFGADCRDRRFGDSRIRRISSA